MLIVISVPRSRGRTPSQKSRPRILTETRPANFPAQVPLGYARHRASQTAP